MTPAELLPRLLLAVAVILMAGWIVSGPLRRLGQPTVVSEMLAGILLGPSLLGLLAPGVMRAVFPPEALPVLYVLGQIGLVLYMFHAGHTFARHRTGRLTGAAGAVSVAGVVAPLALGVLLTLTAGDAVGLPAAGGSPGVAAAFVGVALAITAFPMLARIILDRGDEGRRHGTLSLASGALDDLIAWILLAGVLALASGEAGPAALAVGGAVLFAPLMWFGGRRAAASLMTTGRLDDRGRLLCTVALLFLTAVYTDTIGLHAVFGAFTLGALTPPSERADRVMNAVSPVAGTVLLPLFFTYTGLRTDIGMITDPAALLFTVACVALAVAGKFGACWVAARLCGEPQGVALRVGALMNARGLMQLIAVNAGLEAGIVTPALFTVLVTVALVTTLMTTPLLTRIDARERRAAPAPLHDRAGR
ncbi:cation:proton antiporter [Actinoplanes sp. NEAU-A12]|uniref:Cation:proton antiporter n=1 Tax=Actinoplanes sandaracinus TaxID=3045177 RepID=A0ABT6WL88_9ACTN|nr:cation:proton antiporter [Actinoplanes sandaracinus]MDI6100456.1 cation:proton antiporter [Actinoplanes sandaracinus]